MKNLTRDEVKQKLTNMNREKKIIFKSMVMYVRDNGDHYDVYVEGTKNLRQWLNNATALIPWFTFVPGFSVAADQLDEMLGQLSKPFFLIAHSRASSVSLVWRRKYRKNKQFIEGHCLAPFVCWGRFNFFRPKNMTMYMKKDDIVGWAGKLLAWYKLPRVKKVTLAKTTPGEDDFISDHFVSSYLEVL